MSETSATQTVTMPRIGDKAPAFTAKTTQGPIDFPADYAGKWVILFSHPADFTPVCTSEFMTFATMQQDFALHNTGLVGLSVDGLYSHIAWLRTIQDKMVYRDMSGVEVTFPLIDDVSMEVATKYGMIMPGEAATQAVRPCSSSTRGDHSRDHLLPALPRPELRGTPAGGQGPADR